MKEVTWSNSIHTPDFLYRHRLWRFREANKEKFMELMALPEFSRIIELGCGPGALCRRIKEWFPTTSVVGLDNDSTFIDFAKRNIRGCQFLVMDIKKASIQPADFIISHTIMEYFDPKPFFDCHHRLLKQQGQIILISVVPGSRLNELLWNPQIAEFDFADETSMIKPNKSHLISKQGYNDTSIVRTFQSYQLDIEKIDYFPIITQIHKLRLSEQMEYRAMLESYQTNRLIMGCSNLSKQNILKIQCALTKYYTSLFKNIDSIKPTDIEIIRIIRAKQRCKCT